jgi:hypothetical protein
MTFEEDFPKYKQLGYIGDLVDKKGIKRFILGFSFHLIKETEKQIISEYDGYCCTDNGGTTTIPFDEATNIVNYDGTNYFDMPKEITLNKDELIKGTLK